MKQFFITATGTDIGKTLVTAALTWKLHAGGVNVKAIKPLASGYDAEHPEKSDAAQLLAAQGLPLSEIEAVCPWRFAAPLSPDMAAEEENRVVTLNELVGFCETQRNDITLIEGVGGVMSPVTGQHTVLDWMAALAIPVILVTGSYVGSLSHTLTALHALSSRRIAVHCVIISESAGSAATPQRTGEALTRHMDMEIPLHIVPRLTPSAEMWKNIPDLAIKLL